MIPKLRVGTDLRLAVEFTVVVDETVVQSLGTELQQIMQDLGLSHTMTVRWTPD